MLQVMEQLIFGINWREKLIQINDENETNANMQNDLAVICPPVVRYYPLL